MTRYQDALREVGGLSNPSKMPGKSWSIPATKCITGSKLALVEGSVCSMCYARKSMYVMPNTIEAMERRFQRLQEALNSTSSRGRFIIAFQDIMHHRYRSTMGRLMGGAKVADDGRYFRWHDSGDLQSVGHLAIIVRIAERSPMVRFWLPTKEVGFVSDFVSVARFPRNLTVRLSVPHVNATEPERYRALRAADPQVSFATAHTSDPPGNYVECNAPDTDGKCGDCRRCWNSKDERISYAAH